MIPISKLIQEDTVMYIDESKNHTTKEDLIELFHIYDIKFICFKNSSKLLTKEDVERKFK